MKVFAGLTCGVLMSVSLFFEQYALFVLLLLVGFVLCLSSLPQAFNDEDIKKDASTGDADAQIK